MSIMTQAQYDVAYAALCFDLQSKMEKGMEEAQAEAWFERRVDKLDKDFMRE